MLLKDDVIFLLCVNYITFKFSILYLILNIEMKLLPYILLKFGCWEIRKVSGAVS